MQTLPEVLAAAADSDEGGFEIHLDEGRRSLSLAELGERAQRGAAALVARGIEPGDRVGILGPNRLEWIAWAFAAWSAGATVVPLQVPLRLRDAEAFQEQIEALIGAGACRAVVVQPELERLVPAGLALPWDRLPPRGDVSVEVGPRDTAVVQFTSGSTSAPRGALISHAAMIAQFRALVDLLGVDFGSFEIVMWAPFFHDLGLVLSLVAPVYFRVRSHLLPTERFARHPVEWLRLVGEIRPRVTVGPSSAWSVALRGALRGRRNVDLSSLEYAGFAAEGIDPAVVDTMLAERKRIRLDPQALGATYGLAEAVLCVTATRPGEGITFEHVDATAMAQDGRAEPSRRDARRLVRCGSPLLGMELRVGDDDETLPERRVGEVHVRGESLMDGYTRTNEQPFAGGWLRTGDMGYLADGSLYVTGRAKDMLIAMGHNYYPDDFEWAASRVDGVRDNRCVAFVPGEGPERIVLLVETNGRRSTIDLARSVGNAVANAVGAVPAEVLVVRRGTIERTTSGKLRRASMRAAYERGDLLEAAASDEVA